MDGGKKRNRVDNLTAFFMISVAAVLDLIGIIPIINWVVVVLALMIFGLWFTLLGIKLVGLRQIASAAVGTVVEAIPILSILPGITISVIAIIFMVKSEDKFGFKLPGVK